MDILPQLLNFDAEKELPSQPSDPTVRQKTRPKKLAKLIAPLPLTARQSRTLLPSTQRAESSVSDDSLSNTVKHKTWNPSKAKRPVNNRVVSTSQRTRSRTPENLKHKSPLEFTLPLMATPPRSSNPRNLEPVTPPQPQTPPMHGICTPPHEVNIATPPASPSHHQVSRDFLPFVPNPPLPYWVIAAQRQENEVRRKQRYQNFKEQAASAGHKLHRGKLLGYKKLRNRRRANARRLQRQ